MSEPLIEVRDVSKIYGAGEATTVALDQVCLSVASGEWLAIAGPSGHGKSTLLQLLGGLDRPTKGEIRLNGADLAALPADALAQVRARNIGFVFQFFNLLPNLTALENVELALWLAGMAPGKMRARAKEALESVGLIAKADAFPSMLSGGQQQRVAIARALANAPDVLMMDEPTGNLDSASEAEFLHLLQHLHDEGRTIVMVTHSVAVAQHAERVVYVRDGRLEAGQAHAY